jgi:hypothetical protein
MARRDGVMELDCAPTLHESNAFILLGTALSEKQIPRFVGNVVSEQKKELLESSSVRPRQVRSWRVIIIRV